MPGLISRMPFMHKGFRTLALLLALWLIPSVTCAASHAAVDRFARTMARWASTKEKAVADAIRLVRDGDGGLALARMETHGDGPLLSLRQFTAYLFLELANSMGALPEPRASSSHSSNNV